MNEAECRGLKRLKISLNLNFLFPAEAAKTAKQQGGFKGTAQAAQKTAAQCYTAIFQAVFCNLITV